MHRLVQRAIEEFIIATYGSDVWTKVAAGSRHRITSNDETHGQKVMHAASGELGKPYVEMWEDLGAWLARLEPMRRLLRFSGRDFKDFLQNIVDLPDYTRMVVPDLKMPGMTVVTEDEVLRILVRRRDPEWIHAIAGVVRVMADDYGALGLIWVEPDGIAVQVSDDSFAEARDFHLGAGILREGLA